MERAAPTNLLLIYGMLFTMGYTLYFNLTWLPTYLKDARGFTLQQAGWLSGVVLFTGGVATYVGGKLTDALVKTVWVEDRPLDGRDHAAGGSAAARCGRADARIRWQRRFSWPRPLAWPTSRVSSCWAICHDIGGRNAGIVTGAMNTWGNIGGALSPTRRRLRRRLVELVDAPVLHHRRRLCVWRVVHFLRRSAQTRALLSQLRTWVT